ncbi:MAG: hypothetical protein ACFBZ8_09650 [Opitutales bacterium]
MRLVDDQQSRESPWGVLERPLAKLILALGVLAHIGGFVLLSQAFSVETTAPTTSQAFLMALPAETAQAGNLLSDQALLMDDEPLFLPTQWNASTPSAPNFTNPSAVPDPFGALDAAVPGDLPAVFPPPGPTATAPDETVEGALSFWRHFGPFGAGERALEPVSSRAGFVRLEVSGTGDILVEESVETFPGEDWPTVLWSPVTVHLLVSDRTVPTTPLLVDSSGNALIDARLTQWTASFPQRYALVEGYYTVTIGP